MSYVMIYTVGMLVTAVVCLVTPEPPGYSSLQRIVGSVLIVLIWPAFWFLSFRALAQSRGERRR